jgi:hypothetical protein
MAKYKTAMGRTLDMSTLAAKHEKTRAVGNMSVNARGDTIDSQGKVVVPVTKKVGSTYQKSVSNRAANVVRNKKSPNPVIEQPELTKEELELEASFDDDFEVEQLKSKSKSKSKEEFVVKPASEAPDFFKPE